MLNLSSIIFELNQEDNTNQAWDLIRFKSEDLIKHKSALDVLIQKHGEAKLNRLLKL